MIDFFISYTHADRPWAVWLAWQLEEAGYSTVLPAWDFSPGTDEVREMRESMESADRTIVVLSPDYLKDPDFKSHKTPLFKQERANKLNKLLPVCVKDCGPQLKDVLGSIININLVGLDQSQARQALLAGVRRERVKPASPPAFPGNVQSSKSERPLPGMV